MDIKNINSMNRLPEEKELFIYMAEGITPQDLIDDLKKNHKVYREYTPVKVSDEPKYLSYDDYMCAIDATEKLLQWGGSAYYRFKKEWNKSK